MPITNYKSSSALVCRVRKLQSCMLVGAPFMYTYIRIRYGTAKHCVYVRGWLAEWTQLFARQHCVCQIYLPWCALVTAAWLVDKHMVYYYNNAIHINCETFGYKLLAMLMYHGDVIACFCINFALLAPFRQRSPSTQSYERFRCRFVSRYLLPTH